jgi:hypothetical protein
MYVSLLRNQNRCNHHSNSEGGLYWQDNDRYRSSIGYDYAFVSYKIETADMIVTRCSSWVKAVSLNMVSGVLIQLIFQPHPEICSEIHLRTFTSYAKLAGTMSLTGCLLCSSKYVVNASLDI